MKRLLLNSTPFLLGALIILVSQCAYGYFIFSTIPKMRLEGGILHLLGLSVLRPLNLGLQCLALYAGKKWCTTRGLRTLILLVPPFILGTILITQGLIG